MDAKIHTGFLFIGCLLLWLRLEATCSTVTAMPEAALARNSCDLAETASRSRKAPGEQNCDTGFLGKNSPKAQAVMITTEDA